MKKEPDIDKTAVIMRGAIIAGDVTIGKESSVRFNTCVRGDNNSIYIGNYTCIEENCVLHCPPEVPMKIGNGVTVGHGAILHGCTIGDNTTIGMGAIVITGAVVGSNCLVGAGAVVTPKTVIPDGSLAVGNPAKVVRSLTPGEIEDNRTSSAMYAEAKEMYRDF